MVDGEFLASRRLEARYKLHYQEGNFDGSVPTASIQRVETKPGFDRTHDGIKLYGGMVIGAARIKALHDDSLVPPEEAFLLGGEPIIREANTGEVIFLHPQGLPEDLVKRFMDPRFIEEDGTFPFSE
jgi:hypothetical protein